ncbi:spore coat protein CotH [Sutcliffiella rhizosphaerae]|uniref:Spore coat protein B n=1 Tax=Sutcliffiella rhizosphaerae TaxID=2880967 RepID=A0ABN8AJH8_9BACI|nr:spore coat protein CotH [Sutcliffiella rhizosphaerae]CAG9623707.1 hypothetical protein BACCIP111883_04539 [Sutcliffiella rhizosphaerae]
MEDYFFYDFLESLLGLSVTIYRGGPESRTGTLLDYKDDYLTLHAQDKKNNNRSIIYYQLKHIKSISEDSKINSVQTTALEDMKEEFYQGQDFIDLLDQLIEQKVQINQGGPEAKKGTLIAISQDHLVLFTSDDGVIYINVQHIKSISLQEKREDSKDATTEKSIEVSSKEDTELFHYIEATDFHSLFENLTNKWVSINRGGPEAMEGVLVENAGGYYTLVSNQEILRIHPFHVRSINSGPKGAFIQRNQDAESNISTENEVNVNTDNGSKEDKVKKNNKNEEKNKNKDKDKNKNKDKDKNKNKNKDKNKKK